MTRVGLVSPVLAYGGAEQWMRDLIRFTGPQIEWVGISVLREANSVPEVAASFSVRVAYGPARLASLARSVDVLVGWGIPGFAGYVPNDAGCRTVLVSHGDGPWTAQVFRKPHGCELVAVSKAACVPIPERWRDQVTIIPNGVDPERVKVSRSRSEVRRAWGVKRGRRVLGFLGRLSREKNPLAFVRTLAHLPGWVGVMVGVGADHAELQQEAQRLGVEVLFPGFDPDVGSVLHAFDVLLMPSREEGYGLSVVEAMMADCPVVTTPVGIVPELPDGCVRVVGMKDAPEALSAAVLEDHTERVSQARTWALSHATAEGFGTAWTAYLS